MLEYLCELEIYHIKQGLHFHYYKYEMPYFSTTPNSVLEITPYLESAPGEVLTSNKFTTLGDLTVSDRQVPVSLGEEGGAAYSHLVSYNHPRVLQATMISGFLPLWRQQLGKDTPLPTNGGDAFVIHSIVVIIQLSLRFFYVKLVKYHIRTLQSRVSQHLKMIYAFVVILKAVLAS